MNKKKKVRMLFEIVVPLKDMIDKKILKEEYGNDISKVAEFLLEEEGIWWDKDMKLIDTKIIK